MWINRTLEEKLVRAGKTRPAIWITGARQTGKSSLLQRAFPHAEYITLDRITLAAEAEENPERFLSSLQRPVILDEIQYAPSLLRELKVLIDNDRQSYGQWILTGSQKMISMKDISESLAGRVGIFELETLSAKELLDSGHFSGKQVKNYLWKGGFPEIWATPAIDTKLFFENYIQTYLERDLRTLIEVSNLRDFQRFIQICATRAGQLLNMADIAKDVGVSAVTIKKWISALEASGIIILLPPYFANIGKRLAKSPKLYFSDTGLLCHLLHINHSSDLEKSLYNGSIWENAVLTEFTKTTHFKPGRNLFYYRDQNGVEIDFIIETAETLFLIEAKTAERVDKRKLSFQKVAPLFKQINTQNILMCASTEKRPIYLDNYIIAHPLFHDLSHLLRSTGES